MAIFFQFWAFNNVLKYLFYSAFWTSTKFCNNKKRGNKKNDNFWHFAKHRFIKKTVLLQPPFWPKHSVLLSCLFWNQKHWCWTKNITWNQEIAKTRKRDLKEKTRQETKTKRENTDEENNCHWIFWCCSFHETKAKKKERERKRQKQGTKRKQKRKTRRKKERKEEKRETEKEKQKKREAKKAKGERKRNTENKQNMPFSSGKTRFFVLKSKERKGNKKQNKKTKTNK